MVILSCGCGKTPVASERQEKEEESIQEKAEQAKDKAIRKEEEAYKRNVQEAVKKFRETVNSIFLPQVEQSSSLLVHTSSSAPSSVASHEHHSQKAVLDAAQSSEILAIKLDNPEAVLTSNQSISLVNHCAQLGEQNAAMASDKEVCLALGMAGVGKSTFLNGVMGCKLKVDIDEFDEEIIVVDPESDLGEGLPIGHGRRSQTFLPQIVPDPKNQDSAYCDCPGFTDNRGAEINISNAINIKKVLQQSEGVKAVFLAKYQDLLDRGLGIKNMENICLQMFGGVDNLKRHQNAVLLGITKAPLWNRRGQPLLINSVRSRITQANTPIAQILANRLFLFDSLDLAPDNPDFWSPERCRTEIERLEAIPQQEAVTLFQTTLTGDDQTKLKFIMRDQAKKLAQALEQDNYEAAGRYWQALAQLKIIESDEVERMVEELAELPIKNFIMRRATAFQQEALQYNFDQAEQQLMLLQSLLPHLPNPGLQASLEEMETFLNQCKEEEKEEQKNMDQKLATARRQGTEKVREEIEQKVQRMLDRLETAIQQMGISESEQQRIRAIANDSRNNILDKIGEN